MPYPRKTTKAKTRAPYRKRRYYRKNTKSYGKARPMRKLSLNYRIPNTYRFCRETLPFTTTFSLIAAGTAYPVMGYLNFDNLQFNQLVNSTTEFGALFARYKVDKITTYLTPLFQETVVASTGTPGTTAALRITRVGTKWLNQAFTIQTNADAQLEELAQVQNKSVSNYASNRSLRLTTYNPGVIKKGVVDSSGGEINTRQPMPWLNITHDSDVPLSHNSIIFAERTDGGILDIAWKYRVVHKVWFRCSQVG